MSDQPKLVRRISYLNCLIASLMAASASGACTIPTNVSAEDRRRKIRQLFLGLFHLAIAPNCNASSMDRTAALSSDSGSWERDPAPRRCGPCLCWYGLRARLTPAQRVGFLGDARGRLGSNLLFKCVLTER
jgi:hypothetical protein